MKTGIHVQIRITTKSQPLLDGHLLPGPAKFGRRPFPRSSVILFTEWYRMNERMTENDHITSALLSMVIQRYNAVAIQGTFALTSPEDEL